MRTIVILVVSVAIAAMFQSCKKDYPQDTEASSIGSVDYLNISLVDSLIYTDSIIIKFYDQNLLETVRFKFVVDSADFRTAYGKASFYTYPSNNYISGDAAFTFNESTSFQFLALRMDSIRDFLNINTDHLIYIENGTAGLQIAHDFNRITDIKGGANVDADYHNILGDIETADFDLYYP
jgi:hypothetical protein